MGNSFFFYDLETTGLNPREARIMQFAGIRTDSDLNIIGEPANYLIKQSDDCLPSPEAVLVTGITPQKTLEDGITEIEFIKIFNEEISVPGTTFVGYNNISFDDEFIRFLLYRNYYDPYEWQYKDGRSKWDFLDVIRMTRALRPEGVKWPKDTEDKSTNRLESLAAENKIVHTKAHDAMSDVEALIELSKLIKSKQPKLFNFLLNIRDKRSVSELVLGSKQFVYTAGSFSDDHEKTVVACVLQGSQTNQGALVYDLTVDPSIYESMSPKELAEAWKYKKDAKDTFRLAVKSLQFNRCPSIAPITVLTEDDLDRLKLDMSIIEKNYKKLISMTDFSDKVIAAKAILDENRDYGSSEQAASVEAKLYDGFIGDQDKRQMMKIHDKDFDFEFKPDFSDKRLDQLYPLYVSRNFPENKTDDINKSWQKQRLEYFYSGGKNSRAEIYHQKISEILSDPKITSDKRYLMEELKLWAEAIMPVDSDY